MPQPWSPLRAPANPIGISRRCWRRAPIETPCWRLAAFSAEIRRIPLLVHEPAMGAIRSQWWRDALELPAPLRAGHPVADAVRSAARTYALPSDLLDGVIDASALALPDEPSSGDGDLRAHLWKTEGALFALAGRVLGLPASTEIDAGCEACGHAYGLARLLLDLPRSLAHESAKASPLAAFQLSKDEFSAGDANTAFDGVAREYPAQIRRSLALARHFATGVPRSARPAFLPLALVEPYLRAFERSGPRFSAGGCRHRSVD